MSNVIEPKNNYTIQTALDALSQGYQPLPIRDGDKRPYGSRWSQSYFSPDAEGKARLIEVFTEASENGANGVGLLLGKPSQGLIDVDIDHPVAEKVAKYILPPTGFTHGRGDSTRTHYWYQVEDLDHLPENRRYKLIDKSVSVELRSTGSQTVIPPSTHPSGESYTWTGSVNPLKEGIKPAVIDGRILATQVALVGMVSVLAESWAGEGSRHDAYLNLAGGLLRLGEGVHPFWEKNLPAVIETLVRVSGDRDGVSSRIRESIGTTVNKLRRGQKVGGFPKLAELIGTDAAELTRRMAKEVESLAGFKVDDYRSSSRDYTSSNPSVSARDADNHIDEEGQLVSSLPPEERNPMEERLSSWVPVDLDPYLSGEITVPEPTVLRRSDGAGLFYPGRVNMLFGASESAKSWICLAGCIQEMERGDRVVYLDFEDEPAGMLSRMIALGASREDILSQYRYIHPEGALSAMERGKFGERHTRNGEYNQDLFTAFLDDYDPTLIVVDGMTVLYGLHGLDTNDAMSTDVITSWLKSLTRGGRTSVIVIDHTGKNSGTGASPIGAHHKIAMIQGTALRADAIERPMPGQVGRVNLVVYKDRPGAVRAVSTMHTEEQVACTVVIDSRQEGMTKVSFEKPDSATVTIGATPEAEERLDQLSRVHTNADKILDIFDGDTQARYTSKDFSEMLNISMAEVYDAWKLLTDSGQVQRFGGTRNRTYGLVVRE